MWDPRGPIEKDKCAIFRKNCAILNVINARGYTQICIQRGYDQDGYNYLISSMPEYIMVFISLLKTQSLIAMKSRKRKKREKLRDKREQESIAIT